MPRWHERRGPCNLILHARQLAGRTYWLPSSTDAALPVSQRARVCTNTIVHGSPNNFSAPLPDDLLSRDPQRFYILQSL